MERRKRKRSLAEAQRKEAGKPEEVRREVDENEEEAWPFPMGGAPFGLPRPRRSTKRQPERQSATELDEDEVEVESPVAVEEEPQPGLRERLEREARDIEEQAKQVEARVRESERKIQEAPPRRQGAADFSVGTFGGVKDRGAHRHTRRLRAPAPIRPRTCTS